MFDRFTDRAERVMVLSRQQVQRMHHASIGTEHVLLGMIEEGTGVAVHVLKNRGIDLEELRGEVESRIGPSGDEATRVPVPFSARMKKVLEMSMEEAARMRHGYIGTEHLLLGLLHHREDIAGEVLDHAGADLAGVRGEVLDFLGETGSA